MTQMSTILRSEIAEIKNLILNMPANKRGRKQRKHKESEVASTPSAEQGDKNLCKCMMKLLMIWKRHGTVCVSPKATEICQQGREYHKVIILPARVNRLGRTGVCLTQHG
jgi:hypothetical protein